MDRRFPPVGGPPLSPTRNVARGCLGRPMRCEPVAIGSGAWNVGASRAERAQASLGLVIGQERASNNGAPFTRLLVGDRLLIYVLPASSIDATPDTLAALARQGRAERDTRGYNRFRLVVFSNDPAAQAAAARATFEHAVGDDDKMHLHLVTSGVIPMALGSA
jgi:hypothetical protein